MPSEHRTVRIEEDSLRVESYSTSDRPVIEHFRRLEGDQLEDELSKCLGLGVRVADVASPVLGSEVLRREFEGTVLRHEQLVDDARLAVREEVGRLVESLVGPDGLPKTLSETRLRMRRRLVPTWTNKALGQSPSP
jgi:hypothetical protein